MPEKETIRRAQKDKREGKAPSTRRSRAVREALKHEGHSAASAKALSRQASSAARRRSATSRSAAAKKAAKTKGPVGRHLAAVKAAKTRERSA